jgi:hypothetical protein
MKMGTEEKIVHPEPARLAAQEPHTPGPWHINPGDATGFKTYSGEPGVYARARPTDDYFVLKIAEMDTNVPARERKANARLIAAAPDHALVCWAMCVQDATWEEWGSGKGEFCFAGLRHSTHLDEFGCPVLTDNLRAAIAKATGASQ